MIVSIRSPEDVHKLKHVANKSNILTRFVMDGCHWCESTQPDWDLMTKRAVLSPNDAIAEIESSFINQFKHLIEPKRKVKLPISGYPTVILIKKSGVIKHNGERSVNSYLKLLKSKSKTKRKTRKSTPMKITEID
jgi:hypothetical protein